MVNVTTTCRDLDELTANAQLACRLLFQESYKAGIKDIFITETYRSQGRQDYLWKIGRSILYDTNGKKLSKVTWTTSSNHTSRRAWDIAVAPPKALYDGSTLKRVGAIAARLGITWGGQSSWVAAGKTDQPHFEVSPTWKPPAGYKLEGTVIVPSNSSMKVQLIVTDKGHAAIGPNDGKLYRVQSGTYNTKSEAETARKALGTYSIAKPEYVRIEAAGNKWRFITGTYPSETVARNAIQEMQRRKILAYAEAIPS